MRTIGRTCQVFDLTKSMVEYSTGWQYQKSLTEMIIRSRKENEGTKDSLLLVQHKSVYTLGRGADSSNLKFSVGSPGHPQVYRVERGGDVTWHGPGQVVAYPILDLDGHRRDLHWYVRTVEQVIIDVLKKYNINGERNPINSGVFVNKDKISAVGITASRWITMHGVALNVINDLRSFQDIVPCGIANPDFGVTTMQKHSHSGLSLEDVAKDVVDSFSSNFGLNIEYVDDPIARLEAMRKTFPDIAVPTPITA